MALIPLSAGGGDLLKRVPQHAISGHMYVKLNTNTVLHGRASTTGGTVSIPVLMRSPEPVPTTGHHFPLDTFPGRLPLLHESFPGKSRYGAGRSHTMFPLSRRKSDDSYQKVTMSSESSLDTKGPTKLKLPELELDFPDQHSSRSSVRSIPEGSSNYVDAYKNRLRRKGLDIKEVYSCNRNKPGKDTKQTVDISTKETEPLQRLKFGGQPLSEPFEIKTQKKQNVGRKLRVYKNKKLHESRGNSTCVLEMRGTEQSGRTGSKMEKDFEEFMEDFTHPQGMKRKTYNYGRKLGNIVSPLRMSQLLEVENPIKMENFYNHYM